MIPNKRTLHIVLFRPKPDLSDADRAAMLEALRIASTEIPSVRRFHVGKRVVHDTDYEKRMPENYAYAAVIEFDDLDGLRSYLAHPKHAELGRLFWALMDAGLVYDYETT
jgi:hypothetical protein